MLPSTVVTAVWFIASLLAAIYLLQVQPLHRGLPRALLFLLVGVVPTIAWAQGLPDVPDVNVPDFSVGKFVVPGAALLWVARVGWMFAATTITKSNAEKVAALINLVTAACLPAATAAAAAFEEEVKRSAGKPVSDEQKLMCIERGVRAGFLHLQRSGLLGQLVKQYDGEPPILAAIRAKLVALFPWAQSAKGPVEFTLAA